jgi:RNA polymerase sigma-B factor
MDKSSIRHYSEFAEYRRTGDRRVRNDLLEQHRGLVGMFVKRYRYRGVSSDELNQLCFIAMIHAAERFDPDLGIEFSTFASRTIDGELKRYFRDRTWSVRPPRRMQELHLALRRAEQELVQRLGRSPTVIELAAELDVHEDQVLAALEAGAAHDATSLEEPSAAGGNATRGDRLVVDADYGGVEDAVDVERLLAGLPGRDRELLEMRYFENLTQPEMARRLGVSQSYLSRMLRRILADARAKAG